MALVGDALELSVERPWNGPRPRRSLLLVTRIRYITTDLPKGVTSAGPSPRRALVTDWLTGRYGQVMVWDRTDGGADSGWFREHTTAEVEGEDFKGTAPPGYRVVTVDTASAPELRDLASLRRDLELAKVYSDAFAAQVATGSIQTSRDPALGLWNAAVVAYGRVFNGGVRHNARVLTETLNEAETQSHEYLLDLRNKHVAHAVNGYEDTIVIAYLTDSSFQSPSVTRTGQVHVERLFLAGNAPGELSELCRKHIGLLNNRIRKLHFHVAHELSEMSLAAIYALPDVAIPSGADVKRSRRRK